MIVLAQPLASGNALRILIAPPPGATRCLLLRKDTGTFSGHDDPLAVIVADDLERVVVDFSGLLNGVPVFYCLYSLTASGWAASAVVEATPTASFADLGVDTLKVLRDRLEAGFKVYVDRGDIQHDLGFVPVLKASPQIEETSFPLVTIHLQNESSDVRAVGEIASPDAFDADTGEWLSIDGGFDSHHITIVCWALNSDERIIMRRALRAILQANLDVFEEVGILTPSWSMQDLEDFVSYNAPMFQTICTFECLAVASVSGRDPSIAFAEVVASASQP